MPGNADPLPLSATESMGVSSQYSGRNPTFHKLHHSVLKHLAFCHSINHQGSPIMSFTVRRGSKMSKGLEKSFAYAFLDPSVSVILACNVDILTVHMKTNLTRRGFYGPQDAATGCCFAASTLPHKTQNLTFGNRQIYSINCFNHPNFSSPKAFTYGEMFLEIADFQ